MPIPVVRTHLRSRLFAMSFSLLRTCAPTAGFGRRAASGIALKYATATFSAALAKSPQVLTKVQTELNAISKSIGDTPELKAFVTNPTLSVKDRNAGLSGLYARVEGTGAKKEPVSDITRNLFVILSENGRLGETTGVIEGFNELVAKHKGELNVTVTSAVPLTKDVLTRLEATLKQSQTAQQAKSLKLTNKVNPSVLGGLVVDFGEKTIDLSVSSRINKLNSLLQQSV
ncbi:OSCP, subunit 5 of the stator stalk of mitochondrial F1F0 ATP synthase [Lactarius vividus]|nr:OSCP, subunit 5 of the stator stalk of mitochondrial F1F0 ATP synthase [Lactarius vividus]